MPDDLFGQMFMESEEESYQKILVSLLSKDNISTKTEIQNPLKLTKLHMLGKWLHYGRIKNPKEFIDDFISTYLEYMVSHNRQSRKEIIAALTEGIKVEQSMLDKLTTAPPKV